MRFLKGLFFVLSVLVTSEVGAGVESMIGAIGTGTLNVAVGGLVGARALSSGAQSLKSANESFQGFGTTAQGLGTAFKSHADENGAITLDLGLTKFVKDEVSATTQAARDNMNQFGSVATTANTELVGTGLHTRNTLDAGLNSWQQTNTSIQNAGTGFSTNAQQNMNTLAAAGTTNMNALTAAGTTNMSAITTASTAHLNDYAAQGKVYMKTADGRFERVTNTTTTNFDSLTAQGNLFVQNADGSLANVANTATTNLNTMTTASTAHLNDYAAQGKVYMKTADGRFEQVTNTATTNFDALSADGRLFVQNANGSLTNVANTTTNQIDATGTALTSNVNTMGASGTTLLTNADNSLTSNVNAVGASGTTLLTNADGHAGRIAGSINTGVQANSNAFQAQVASTGAFAQYQVSSTVGTLNEGIAQQQAQLNSQLQMYSTLTHAQVQTILATTTPLGFSNAVLIAPNSQEIIWWLNKLDAGALGAATTAHAMSQFLNGQRVGLATQLKTLRDAQVQKMIVDDYAKLSPELRMGAKQIASTAQTTQQLSAMSAQIYLNQIDQPYYQPYFTPVERQQIYQLKSVFSKSLQVVVRSMLPTMTTAAFVQFKRDYGVMQNTLRQNAHNATLQVSNSLTALHAQAADAIAQVQEQASDAVTDTEAALQAEIEAADAAAVAAAQDTQDDPDIEEVDRDNLDVATEEVTNEDGTTQTVIGRR